MKTVAAAIKAATSNDPHGHYGAGAHVDAKEAISIVKAAVYGKDGKRSTPVTKGEVGLIVDLFDRQVTSKPWDLVTMAMPENPGQVSFDAGAGSTVKAFLANHGVQHPAVLKDQVNDALAGRARGEPLAVPPDVSNMTYVFLRDSHRVDGDRAEAYVDTVFGNFYLKSTGAGMAGPDTVGPFWYGPMDLAPVEKMANVATREKLEAIKGQITQSQWRQGAPNLPMGPQFEAVPLSGAGPMVADGYNYTAYLPVGVVYPGAPQSDPNEAQYAFIMRSGGYAGGMTNVVRVDLTEAAQAA